MSDMNCAERARHVGHLERTAKAYAEAVAELRDVRGYDLIAQQKLVAHIRAACDAAQAALTDHEEAHHCTHQCARVESVKQVMHVESPSEAATRKA